MIIPKDIIYSMKDPRTKAAFLSEFKKVGSGDCENCGGAGVVAAFIATEGPYDAPAGPYLTRKDEYGKETRLTSKSEEIHGQTRWWVGQTMSLPCPVCQGEHAPKGQPMVQQSIFEPAHRLGNKLTSPAARSERNRMMERGEQ